MSCRINHRHVKPCGDAGAEDYCACGCSAYDEFCQVEDGSTWRDRNNQHLYLVWLGYVTDAGKTREGAGKKWFTRQPLVMFARADGIYAHYTMPLDQFLDRFEWVQDG